MSDTSTHPPLRARTRAEIEAGAILVGDRTIVPLTDGEFRMSREFLSDPGPHDHYAGPDGVVRLPIGCFLIPGDKTVLIDLGYGSHPESPAPLRGGLLLEELAAIGLGPESIDLVAISHLHGDHRGWLATPEGEPRFSRADLVMDEADLTHFLADKVRPLAEHERAAIEATAASGRLRLLDATTEVLPGLVALPAPGHTPGHTVYALGDKNERALLLGDSMYCPQQLNELDWGAASDVDPVLARQTRAALIADLESHDAQGVGCHFPNLTAARVLTRS